MFDRIPNTLYNLSDFIYLNKASFRARIYNFQLNMQILFKVDNYEREDRQSCLSGCFLTLSKLLKVKLAQQERK